jgi:arabinofuranan 3-O-arabinosyltransferase
VKVTRLAVTAGSYRKVVTPDALGLAVTDFAGHSAFRVRVTVLDISGHQPTAQVAIRDIAVAGVDTSRTLVVPDAGADASTSFVFSADPPRRPCLYGALGTSCDPDYARQGAERGHVDRTFTVHGSGSWAFSGTVVAQPSIDTGRLLLPVGAGLASFSTSVLGGDPAVSATFATDGQSQTSWLQLNWGTPRTLRRLQVTASAIPALTPYLALIEANGQTRRVPVSSGALGYFAPISGATSARVTLLTHRDPEQPRLSMGVGEVRIDGLTSLSRPVPLSWRFTSPCGLGPNLYVDGQVYRTRVSGTLGDIVAGRTLDWNSCDRPVRLGDGTSRLQVNATGIFTPTRVVLRSAESGQSGPVVVTRPRAVLSTTALAPTMSVGLAAGPASVLVFSQNANPGWRATMAGRALATTVVDGWQQGFAIPPGPAGTVRISFASQSAYQAALGIGAAGVLVLLLLLLLDLRRADVVVLGTDQRRPGRAARIGGLACGLAILTIVSPVAAGAGLLGWLLIRARWKLDLAAALLVLGSAVVAAFVGGTAVGVPGDLADVLGGLGCGLLAATLTPRPGRADVDA